MPVLHHLQHQTGRDGERGDQRNVDAAAEHDDRHGQAENAKHRHVLQQRQHVVGGEEALQEDGEDNEQRREYDEDDFLLCEPDALHDLDIRLQVRSLSSKPVRNRPTTPAI